MYLDLHVNDLILALSACRVSTNLVHLNLPVNYRNQTLSIDVKLPFMYLNHPVNYLNLCTYYVSQPTCQRSYPSFICRVSTNLVHLNLPVNYRNLTLSIDIKLPFMYLNHPVNYLNLYLLCISTYMSTILS